MKQVTVVSVSYNTKELTALLLWSLHRILDPPDLSILVVDNGSTDGSADLLRAARDAGLCELIANDTNLGHGPALNIAMSAAQVAEAPRVWILDSDCVITRPEALRAPLTKAPNAAIIGEARWDTWHGEHRFGLFSLILDPAALADADAAHFTNDGDPSWELLQSAVRAGLEMASFPFTADDYLVHLGRASLTAVFASGDVDHPHYEWATRHHEPHYGGVAQAKGRHSQILTRFRTEVGPELELVAALQP